MHHKYKMHEQIKNLTPDQLKAFVEFRYRFLEEELRELLNNINDPEQVVDAIIDLCVVAIGTLDLLNVDVYKAWDEVHRANMAKEVGIKESRPNPFGFPDLVKPAGWVAPSHEGNHGLLDK